MLNIKKGTPVEKQAHKRPGENARPNTMSFRTPSHLCSSSKVIVSHITGPVKGASRATGKVQPQDN